ncbi:hypothetical protein ACFYP4_02460 [Streptomyces sp. NPDC005551]|uniref:hypothetical protein n=1 Tax=Streptomyces sp. NPDC005551 TaxID=3364725 RepID=UPI00367A1F04
MTDDELRDKILSVVKGTVGYDQEELAVDLIMAVVRAHNHCASCDGHSCDEGRRQESPERSVQMLLTLWQDAGPTPEEING